METAKSFQASYAALGKDLFQAERYQDALDALKKALAEPPTGVSRHEIYLTLGRTYSALNKDKDALAAFSEAVRLHPETFPAVEKEILKLQTRAGIAEEASALSKGIGGWLRSIISGASSLIAKVSKSQGITLFKNEKFAEAESLLSIASTSLPEDAEIHEYLGWSRLKQRKTVESIDSFLRATSLEDKRAYSYQGLGEAYLALQQDEKALAALKRALELKPGDPASLLSQGTVLRNLKDYAASEEILRKIIEQEPQNIVALRELGETLRAADKTSEAATILSQAANLTLARKEYAEAEQLSQQAIDLDASKPGGYLHLGKALIGQRQYEKALDALNRAFAIEPTPAAELAVAQAQFLQSDLTKASDHVDHVLTVAHDLPEALGLKGAILQRWKQHDEALRKLDESLKLNPDQAQFCTERGHALEASQLMTDAVAAYTDAVKLDPSNRWAHGRMGVLLYNEEKYKEAAAALKEALALPSNEEEDFYKAAQPLQVYEPLVLHLKRGHALHKTTEYVEAISEFEAVTKLDPANAEACAWRGSSLFYLDRYQEAVEAFQLSIDLYAAEGGGDLGMVYAELGESFRELGKYRESKTTFKQALNLKGDDAWVLSRYGDTLRMLDKLDESEDMLRKSVELDRNNSWSLGALGATLEASNKYRSALAALEQALTLAPQDSFNLAYKGKILRQAKRYPQALEALNQALLIDAQTAWVWFEKGMTMRDMADGNTEEALSYFEKAIELSGTDEDSLFELSICQHKAGKYSEALKSVNETLRLDSTSDAALCVRSLILNKFAPDLARESHDKALGNSTNADAYYRRGSIYGDLATVNGLPEAYELGIKDLEEAINKNPEHNDAYNDLAWICALAPQPDLDKALGLAKRAAENDPSSGDYHDTLGWILFRQHILAEALVELEKAVELASEDLEIADHLDACGQSIQELSAAGRLQPVN